MIVTLTKAQVRRLKHLALSEMERYGYDGDEPPYRECEKILDALEHGQTEPTDDKVKKKRKRNWLMP